MELKEFLNNIMDLAKIIQHNKLNEEEVLNLLRSKNINYNKTDGYYKTLEWLKKLNIDVFKNEHGLI